MGGDIDTYWLVDALVESRRKEILFLFLGEGGKCQKMLHETFSLLVNYRHFHSVLRRTFFLIIRRHILCDSRFWSKNIVAAAKKSKWWFFGEFSPKIWQKSPRGTGWRVPIRMQTGHARRGGGAGGGASFALFFCRLLRFHSMQFVPRSCDAFLGENFVY